MKLMKYLLPLAMAVCGVTTVNASDFSTVQEARERDPDAVLDYLKSKRAISMAEKGGNLTISGDIKVEWDYMHAHGCGKKLRGSGSGKSKNQECSKPKFVPFATSEFNTEVDLMFDYRTDRTWAAIQFQFSNPMGIRQAKCVKYKDNGLEKGERNRLFGSGEQDNISMRKAFMGYNFINEGTSRLDLELGHRRLYDVFDSEVQFYNFFDGALLKYAHSFEGITDLTAKVAGFVVDQNVNHFGYAGELGLLNIADIGVDLKYSIIDWRRDGANRYGKKHAEGSEFLVSQYTAAYTLPADWILWKTKIYGAFLHNHDAKKDWHSYEWRDGAEHKKHFHDKKGNAWYAGVRIGEVRKRGDWALDANYQWVEAQAVPESDVSGIKRDNPANLSMYRRPCGGFANYRGYKFDAFYAFTDNLTVNASWEKVREESHKIGGRHRSSQFQLSAIYAF